MIKILWIDLETTGRDERLNGIHQLSGLIQIDNKIVDTFDFHMNPGDVQYDPEAEAVTGIGRDTIRTYPAEFSVFPEFMAVLDKHIDRFDKTDKFMLAGYYIDLNWKMLTQWFRLNKEDYYMSYFQPFKLDVAALCAYATMHKRTTINTLKLEAMCILFGIDIGDTHNSMSDIVATYKLFHELSTKYIPIQGI